MSGRFAIQILAETCVQRPVQFVFDAPVLAAHRIQPHRAGPKTRNVVTDFALDLPRTL